MSYVNMLGNNSMKRFNYVVVKELPIIEGDTVIIEFKNDYLISNCMYSTDIEYGIGLHPKIIEGSKVTFTFFINKSYDGYESELESAKFEIKKIKKGDKFYFMGMLRFGGEYSSGKSYKYAEL